MKIEENLASIEKIAEELESEDTDLEKGISRYAEAMKLAKKTLAQLTKAEQKLTILHEEGDNLFQMEE